MGILKKLCSAAFFLDSGAINTDISAMLHRSILAALNDFQRKALETLILTMLHRDKTIRRSNHDDR
jgi:hypothetical protein